MCQTSSFLPPCQGKHEGSGRSGDGRVRLLANWLHGISTADKIQRVHKHPASKASSLPTEDTLRMRLQFHPHDADAHKELIKLLDEKYAFRAIVAEDTTWLSNNRSDSWALTEIVSYSETALHDPEYAIAQLRLQLAAVPRKDDPEDFDDWSDQLAAKLQKRGRPEEALPLLSELVRLNPNEAGFWADYGDLLSALGQNADAIKAFRRSIELNPSMESFHEGFAEALVKSGDLNGAESEYRAALSIYDAQYKKGEPTDSYHSFISGMVKIEAAHGEEHALAETRMKLAHILLLDKKYDEALVQAKAALDADHNEFAAFYLQAEIYDAKGEHDQANKMRANAATTVQKEAASEAGLEEKQTRHGCYGCCFSVTHYGMHNQGIQHFPQRLFRFWSHALLLFLRLKGLNSRRRTSRWGAWQAESSNGREQSLPIHKSTMPLVTPTSVKSLLRQVLLTMPSHIFGKRMNSIRRTQPFGWSTTLCVSG